MQKFTLAKKERIWDERIKDFQAKGKNLDKPTAQKICEQSKAQPQEGPWVYYLKKSEKTPNIFLGTRAVCFWRCPAGTTPEILSQKTNDFRPDPLYLTDDQIEEIKNKTPCSIDAWSRAELR